MTARAKIFLVVGFTVLATSGGWHQTRASRRQAAEIAELVQRTARQRSEVQRLRAECDALLARAIEPPPNPMPAFATGDAAFDARMEAMLGRMNQLRKWLKDQPTEKIPEFEFLRDTDWIEIVSNEAKAEFDVRGAAHNLRFEARANFATLLQAALKSYAEANEGRLPENLAQLTRFFVSPIPPAILQRYEMRAAGPVEAVPRDLPIISERAEAVVASEEPFVLFANRVYGIERFGRSPFLYAPERSPQMAVALSKANQAFRLAHSGAYPRDATQLLPYFEDPRLAANFVEFAEGDSAKETLSNAIDEGLRGYAAANSGRKPANREDLLPYIRDPHPRAILAAKDFYLKEHGQHATASAELRPYVKDPATRELLEKIIRAESERRTP